MNVSQFNRLRTFIDHENDRFSSSLWKLRSGLYPSSVASEFISFLSEEAASQRLELSHISDDYKYDAVGATSRLRSEGLKLRERYQYLDAISNAQSDCVPWSLIPSIERISSSLLPGRKILTTSSSEMNYAINFYDAAPAGISQFFTVVLPRVQRGNPFLHLLVGHELFHPLAEDFFPSSLATVAPILKVECEKYLKQNGLASDLFASRRLDQMVNASIEFWRKALTEVMCDLACAWLFGPAACFSASSFARSVDLDEKPSPEGQLYPPWRYRLRTMLRFAVDSDEGKASISRLLNGLEKKAQHSHAKCFVDEIEAERLSASVQDDLKKINTDPVLRFIYANVETFLADAWSYVRRKLEPFGESWHVAVDSVPDLLIALRDRVPPGEVRSPGSKLGIAAPLAGIAMASWIELLSIESSQADDKRLNDFKVICRLTLKAFEDSEVKRRVSSRFTTRG